MLCFLSFLWTLSLILERHALCWAGFRYTARLEWSHAFWVSFPLEHPCFALEVKCYAFNFPWRKRPGHLESGFALWMSSPEIFHCIYLHLSWHCLSLRYPLLPRLALRIFLLTPSYQGWPCSFQLSLITPGQRWKLLPCRTPSVLKSLLLDFRYGRALSYF